MHVRFQLALAPSDTNISYVCSSTPAQMNVDPSCSGRRLTSANVESTGAVVIAVVSGIILLTAVGILFFLQRHGKLEQYL